MPIAPLRWLLAAIPTRLQKIPHPIRHHPRHRLGCTAMSTCSGMGNSHYSMVTTKHQKGIVLIACCLFLMGIGVLLFSDWERQPNYHDRTLSEWLAIEYDLGAA